MPEIIVVGVDGSGTAARAAQRARDLAVGLEGALHVVVAYVADRAASSEWTPVPGDSESSALEAARKVAGSLATEGLEIETFAVPGTPADALMAHAEQHGAGLIVVGNRRMKGLARVLGSVANSLAHEASCDVYIAHTVD